MSSTPKIEENLRAAILSHPDAILEDPDVMQALVTANDASLGSNVVDLRGIAMDRMEARLDRLEDTHKSVIAAAYENLAGTQQIHRAILAALEPSDLETFLTVLRGDVADILRVDRITLVLEHADAAQAQAQPGLALVDPGFVDSYLNHNRQGSARQVTLRQIPRGSELLFDAAAAAIRSEACLVLDFGAGTLPGMLVLGSSDGGLFGPQQGTDLLAFFAGVCERNLRRWLSWA